MSITFYLRKDEYKIEGNLTVKQALKQLGLSPEAYLVVRNGEMLTESEMLRDGDKVKLIAVISGGDR